MSSRPLARIPLRRRVVTSDGDPCTIVGMPDPPALAAAREIAAQWPRKPARVVTLPRELAIGEGRDVTGTRSLDVEWEARSTVRDDSDRALYDANEIATDVEEGRPTVATAVEGVCRVTIGGARHGEKFTAIVVHVTADGEPVRTVFLPVE